MNAMSPVLCAKLAKREQLGQSASSHSAPWVYGNIVFQRASASAGVLVARSPRASVIRPARDPQDSSFTQGKHHEAENWEKEKAGDVVNMFLKWSSPFVNHSNLSSVHVVRAHSLLTQMCYITSRPLKKKLRKRVKRSVACSFFVLTPFLRRTSDLCSRSVDHSNK